ncbi:MAG: YihY family inner membrane protein [Candidatus Eisenbacteria bacterium]|nr:YihY family inner membrane protein [Candidatus Eisenbacteria bacterium]
MALIDWTAWRQRFKRLGELLGERLWEEDFRTSRGLRGFAYRQLRVIVVVGRSLPRGQIPVRAAAMTLATLFALVPGIVLAFSLLGVFGGLEEVRLALQRFVLRNVVPSVQDQVAAFLSKYFQGATAFQGINIAFLLGGVFGLLATVEDAFNHIWGIKRGRNLIQRLTTYTTIAVLGPFLTALSVTLTASIQHASVFDRLESFAPVGSFVVFAVYGILPIGITILGLTLLYWIMPNTRVNVLSALGGALVSGLLWEISKWGYGFYLSSASMYQTLYGPLVAIPLLFLWVQLSWVIVLFGALLTFAREAADDFQLEEGAVTASFRERMKAALICMTEICRSYRDGEPAPTVVALSSRLHIAVRLVRSTVSDLAAGELLHEIVRTRDRGEGGLVPARDPQSLTVHDVIECLRMTGTSTPNGMHKPGLREVERILLQIDESLARLGKSTSFADIVSSAEKRGGPAQAGPVKLFKR